MLDEEPQIAVENRDRYLFANFPRYESVKKSRAHISELFDAVDRYDATKVLIETRATREQVPILEMYELCLYLVSKFGLKSTKLAVIVSPGAAYPDRFGENVVRNRGVDLIRFIDDEQEALAWLLEP